MSKHIEDSVLQDAYEREFVMFRDRVDAGVRLAQALRQYDGKEVLVLGIPRGGVIVAAEVASQLDAELDVLVARKLGAPFEPELAIGAVTANGGRFLNPDMVSELGISDAYLEEVTTQQMTEARGREERLRGIRPAARVTGRIVLLVDDGLATGATMRAAVRSVKSQKPARVVVAVPIGSPHACEALRHESDEVVCLYEPAFFFAIGAFYEHFEPTQDDEIQRLLQETRAPATTGGGASSVRS